MHKYLVVLLLVSTIFTSKPYDNGAAMISHELAHLNQTLINNQPAIDGNINRSVNSIQRILAYDNVYDHEEELDQHFMNLETAIEAGLIGDQALKTQCKANLAFLRRVLKQSITRTSNANSRDRLTKFCLGSLNALCGAILVGISATALESIINKRDINLFIESEMNHFYGSTSTAFIINPSKDGEFKRAFTSLPFLLPAILSTPIFYLAAKALKRGIFFNDHLKNREECIQKYSQREQELEKSLENSLN